MDYSNIPACALFRHGTVIVRLKMEVACSCGEPEDWPLQNYPEAVHRPLRCKQCSRTRTNSRYSDCDSDLVDKCRPYRSSAARSRYVNVCAAVCLLLLVGDLLPQTWASPYTSSAMDRQKRCTQEDHKWANPCDVDGAMSSVEYTPEIASKVAKQAEHVLRSMLDYKDELAQQLLNTNFDTMIKDWQEYRWMNRWQMDPIFQEKIIPADKVYGKSLEADDLSKIMGDIDNRLPAIYKGLKMVVASMYRISARLPQVGANPTTAVELKLKESSVKLRLVLCECNELMRSRNQEIMAVFDHEIPPFDMSDRVEDASLVYRDTLNYLEYITQIFEKMATVPN